MSINNYAIKDLEFFKFKTNRNNKIAVRTSSDDDSDISKIITYDGTGNITEIKKNIDYRHKIYYDFTTLKPINQLNGTYITSVLESESHVFYFEVDNTPIVPSLPGYTAHAVNIQSSYNFDQIIEALTSVWIPQIINVYEGVALTPGYNNILIKQTMPFTITEPWSVGTTGITIKAQVMPADSVLVSAKKFVYDEFNNIIGISQTDLSE